MNEATPWFAQLQAADCSNRERAALQIRQDAYERRASASEQGSSLTAGIDHASFLCSRVHVLLDEALFFYASPTFVESADGDLLVHAFGSALPLRIVHGGEREMMLFRRHDDAPR